MTAATRDKTFWRNYRFYKAILAVALLREKRQERWAPVVRQMLMEHFPFGVFLLISMALARSPQTIVPHPASDHLLPQAGEGTRDAP